MLVGTPIYNAKEYCREAFVKNVQTLNYPNFHWVLVDNSRKPSYYHKLRRLYPGHVARVPRGNNSRDALANAQEFLRKKALEQDYDYLLMLESDIFPPKDVIQRLMNHGQPVVGAIYKIGNTQTGEERLCIFKTTMKEAGLGTELINHDEQEDYFHKGLKQVHGMGVGCTLIDKSILARYPFWYSTADDIRIREGGAMKHSDVYFYLDLHNDGRKVYADTDVFCHHEYSDWTKVADA